MSKHLIRLFWMLSLLVVLGLCGCGSQDSKAEDSNASEPEYPQIVNIENNLYYGTGEICEMVPRKAPDGVIDTIVEKEIMPDAMGSANFGQEQGELEYMFLEDGRLIVHIDENWYYFTKE